jgi:hypothetical protein
MRSVLVVCALALLALLGGCTSKHAVDSLNTPPTRLSRDASFYVVVPRDGQYGGKSYAGSGRHTVQAVVAALAAHVSKAVAGETPEDLSVAIKKAQNAGLTYVFDTQILNWEDRNTEWSGIPDRITLKMSVHEVATGKVIASTVARASSKWATFGGDHPQDLLPKPTQDFVAQLF